MRSMFDSSSSIAVRDERTSSSPDLNRIRERDIDVTRDVTGARSSRVVRSYALHPFLDTPIHSSYLLIKWVMMAAAFQIAGTSFGTNRKPNRPTKRIKLVPGGSSALSPRYVPSF